MDTPSTITTATTTTTASTTTTTTVSTTTTASTTTTTTVSTTTTAPTTTTASTTTTTTAPPTPTIKVAVFGGGSFGTALGYIVAKNPTVFSVKILSRNEVVVESINKNHTNSDYVQGFVLPSNMSATTNPEEALKDVSFIIHAIPVQQSRDYLRKLKDKIPPHAVIISSSKGICTETLKMMNEIIPEALERPNHPTAFVSGPTFAKELLSDVPTGLVVASTGEDTASRVQRLFYSPTIRAYTSNDVVGVEVGGALKNIFAIAAGVCSGIGLGINSKAMVVTRGVSEMTRIAIRMGAKPETLAGLSGIGDLMLTCFGSLSRNLSVGLRLGQGEAIQDILASMSEVAEGVATAPAALRLAQRYKLNCPIIEEMNRLLKGETTPRECVKYLMQLPTGPEVDYTSITVTTEILSEIK